MSIINILFILILLVLITILTIIIYSIKYSPKKKTQKSVKFKRNKFKADNLNEIVYVRLFNGIEESIVFAKQFEEKLIIRLSEDDNEVLSPEKIRVQQDTLNFLEIYRDIYCSPTISNEKKNIYELINRLKKIQGTDNSYTLPVYLFLIEVHQFLCELSNFQLLISHIKNYNNKFNTLNTINDDHMKKLISILQKLTKCAQDNYELMNSDIKKDKQSAFHNFTTEFEKFAKTITTYEVKYSEQETTVPELLFLRDAIINPLIELSRQKELDLAERPKFEITMINDNDFIEIDSNYITLKFKIKNIRHELIQIDEIEIFLLCKSSDFKYSGDWENIQLNQGRKIIDFGFHTYIFQKNEFDKYPIIEFKISYWLSNKKFEQEIEYKLPEIKPKIHIVNPFKEGKHGTGLSGQSTLFTGRETVLRKIAIDLLDFNSESLYYWIVGQTRTGKTSVLNQLKENPKWLKKKYIPILISPQKTQNISIFFEDLYDQLKDILKKLNIHIQNPDEKKLKNSNAPKWQIVTELFRLNEVEILRSEKRILFLVDEAQEISTWERPETTHQDARGRLFFQFPEFIKVLRDSYGKLAVVILAGHLSLEDLRPINPEWIKLLGGRITTSVVSNFNKAESDELIKKKIQEQNLLISQENLDIISEYTNGHPFLHILMGYHLYEIIIEKGNLINNYQISVEDINLAALRISGDDMKFLWLDPWIDCDYSTKLFLGTLAEISYNQEDTHKMPFVSVENIKQHLFHKYNIPYNNQYEFTFCINKLRSHQIIEKHYKENKYKLLYPLFAIFAMKKHLLDETLKIIRRQTRQAQPQTVYFTIHQQPTKIRKQ